MYSSPFLATYGWNDVEPLFTFLTGAALPAGALAAAGLAAALGAALGAGLVALTAGFEVLEVAMSFLKDGQKGIYKNP